MNLPQTCVHIARHSADRLAIELSPDLPREVDDVFADADRTDRAAELAGQDTGYDPPPLRDAAALIAACAIHGTEALRPDSLGARPTEDLPAGELHDMLLAQLRLHTAPPPGISAASYERILRVVAEEVVAASRRRDMPRGRA